MHGTESDTFQKNTGYDVEHTHYLFSSCLRNYLLGYSSALMENSSDSSVVQRLQLR